MWLSNNTQGDPCIWPAWVVYTVTEKSVLLNAEFKLQQQNGWESTSYVTAGTLWFLCCIFYYYVKYSVGRVFACMSYISPVAQLNHDSKSKSFTWNMQISVVANSSVVFVNAFDILHSTAVFFMTLGGEIVISLVYHSVFQNSLTICLWSPCFYTGELFKYFTMLQGSAFITDIIKIGACLIGKADFNQCFLPGHLENFHLPGFQFQGE